MTISTEPMGASIGLQRRQATSPLEAGGASMKGVESKSLAASAKADQTSASVVKPAADARHEIDKPSASQLEQSLEDINKVLAGFSISVQFQVDPDYKELIVKVVDQDSGKLIRQIPTEDVVRMSKAMDNLKGLLFFQAV